MNVAISTWGNGLYFISSIVKVINSLISRPLLFCDSCGILSFFLWVEQSIWIGTSYCFSSFTFFWFLEHFKLFLYNLATYRTVVFWLFSFQLQKWVSKCFFPNLFLGVIGFFFPVNFFLWNLFMRFLFILILSRLLFPLGLLHGVLIFFLWTCMFVGFVVELLKIINI